MEKFKYLKKGEIGELPAKPGVYALSKQKGILYIGKAVNLRSRVKSHFQKTGFKDDLFIDQVQKVGFIETGSEIEALILEARLIKKHQPQYNVLWKDDKNYFFVGITAEDFPRVFITHQPQSEVRSMKYEVRRKKRKLQTSNFRLHTSFIGPFVDGTALKQTLKHLRKVFPFRSCKNIPDQACLWYQLGRCPGFCLLEGKLGEQISKSKLKNKAQQNVENLIRILKGGKTDLVSDLEQKINQAAQEQRFERAAQLKQKLLSLKQVLANSRVLRMRREQDWETTKEQLKQILNLKGPLRKVEAYDVSNIQGQQATGSQVAFIEGQPAKDFYRRFKIKISGEPNDVAMLKEVLRRRLGHPEWPFPDLILVDGGKAQVNAALKVKSEFQESQNIKVVGLAKGEQELFVEDRKGALALEDLPQSSRHFIKRVDQQAHRFALKYHRKLREEELFSYD